MKVVICSQDTLAWFKTLDAPSIAARAGASGVVGVLVEARIWLALSIRTVSVKVPPISMASWNPFVDVIESAKFRKSKGQRYRAA